MKAVGSGPASGARPARCGPKHHCDRAPHSPPPCTLRIALIASARFPLREPFDGGLEAQTWQLATALTARGHDVCVYAGRGSDPGLHVHEIPPMPPPSRMARKDVSMPPEFFLAEHSAYLTLMLDLAADRSYDLVHNNSLHYLPIVMADTLSAPMMTTLHTPPTPWLESAITSRPSGRVRYVAVSRATARQWHPTVPDAAVVPNGIDLSAWTPGAGGGAPVWSGRIVPEKGLELAIGAARLARTGLLIAGPRSDPAYFERCIAPMLGDGIEYLGHLDHLRLAAVVGSATVVVVSPRWEEPYGLVVAEALASGTPVAGFRRGALPELIDGTNGLLAPPDDVGGLAEAMVAAARLDRGCVRASAERTCSVEVMVDKYEDLYRQVLQ